MSVRPTTLVTNERILFQFSTMDRAAILKLWYAKDYTMVRRGKPHGAQTED